MGGYSPDVGPGRLRGAALLKGWVVQCSLQPQLSLEQSGIISVYELTFFLCKRQDVQDHAKSLSPLERANATQLTGKTLITTQSLQRWGSV